MAPVGKLMKILKEAKANEFIRQKLIELFLYTIPKLRDFYFSFFCS